MAVVRTVDTMGKAGLPSLIAKEKKPLGEILTTMESRAKQMLSGGEKAKAINLPAWEKLTFKVDEGETLPHFLTGHKTGESRLAQSIKDGGIKDVFPATMTDSQIIKSIKTAYKNAEKLETQIRGNGEKVIVLLGEADEMKIKMYINLTTKELETAFPQWR